MANGETILEGSHVFLKDKGLIDQKSARLIVDDINTEENMAKLKFNFNKSQDMDLTKTFLELTNQLQQLLLTLNKSGRKLASNIKLLTNGDTIVITPDNSEPKVMLNQKLLLSPTEQTSTQNSNKTSASEKPVVKDENKAENKPGCLVM